MVRWLARMGALGAALGSSRVAAQSAPPSGASATGPSARSASGQAITPPRLVHFVHAEYPAAAREQRLERSVVLALSIDPEGRVTSAEVREGAGHGFDEAARTAALGFRFEPARRGGKPTSSRILFRYSFTLLADAADESPAFGDLLGRAVLDAKGVAGARVTMSGPGGRSFRANTDANGRWRASGLVAGDYTITVEAPGFEPASHVERVQAGEAIEVIYELAPAAAPIEIVVRGERRGHTRFVTRRRLTQRELTRIPGTNGDPIRALESMPGVARTASGTPVIRGSSPLATGVFLDGLSIPYLYHVYDLASVVPADMVEHVDLYPGNYGTRYGRYIGGIVEVGLRSPRTDCTRDGKPTGDSGCYHGLAQFDLMDGRLMLEGPVPAADGWSFAVSGRRSWIDFVLKKAADTQGVEMLETPHYRDLYAVLEHEGPRRKLSLRAYHAEDGLELVNSEHAVEDPELTGLFRITGGFERAQAQYEESITEELELHTTLGIGRDRLLAEISDLSLRYTGTPITFRHELSASFSGQDLHVGADFLIAPYELSYRMRRTTSDFSPIEEKSLKGTDGTFAAYVESTLRPNRRSSLTPGVRVEYAPVFDELTVGPRLSARYDLVPARGAPGEPGFRRSTLKGGAGVHYQPPSLLMLGANAREPNQQSERALQFSFGLEQDVTRNVGLSLEGFLVKADRILYYRPAEDGTQRLTNGGERHSYGLEALLRYDPDERFFGWIAYTLSRSVTRDEPDTEPHVSEFDQTHNLVLVGSYRLGSGWEIGARFRYVTGSPFTDVVGRPYVPALLDGSDGQHEPLYAAPFSDRMPDVHQLDLRVDKRWQFRAWAFSTYLDVRNIYNHRVVNAFAYNPDFTERKPVQGLPLYPSLGVRGEF